MIAWWSCCSFDGCTSMMWIFCSTMSQRSSFGLRSVDCEGDLSKVNQVGIILALWCVILLVIKRWTWSACCGIKIVLKGGPNCAKKIYLIPLYHQRELLIQVRMYPCFHVSISTFEIIEMSQQKPRLIRPGSIFQLLLCNFGKPMWIVALSICS